jgi:hypothetical protein
VLIRVPSIGPIEFAYNADSNFDPYPFELHMVLYKYKQSNVYADNTLKIYPGNTTGPIDSTIINSLYPYNRDQYQIKKVKIFKLKSASVAITGGISNPTFTTLKLFYDACTILYLLFIKPF